MYSFRSLLLQRADLPGANRLTKRTTEFWCQAVGWSALLSSPDSAGPVFLYGTRGCGGEALTSLE